MTILLCFAPVWQFCDTFYKYRIFKFALICLLSEFIFPSSTSVNLNLSLNSNLEPTKSVKAHEAGISTIDHSCWSYFWLFSNFYNFPLFHRRKLSKMKKNNYMIKNYDQWSKYQPRKSSIVVGVLSKAKAVSN